MRPPVCNSEDHPESGREVQEHGSSCPRRARSRQRQGKGPGRFQIRRPVTPSTTSRQRSREKEGSRSAVPDLRRQAAGGPSPTTTSGRISSPSWWREDLCEDFDRQDHHFERRDLSHHQHRQGKDPGQGRLQLLCHDNIRLEIRSL